MRVVAVVVLLFGCLCSCAREQKNYKGSYSFKTSGNLTLKRLQVLENDTLPASNDSLWYLKDTLELILVNEFGQMNIGAKTPKDKRMVVTMNAMGGDAVSFLADAQVDSLVLQEQERYVLVQGLGLRERKIKVKVKGKGVRYGNILLFNLDYDASLSESGYDFHTIQSEVLCVAEQNED